VLSKEHPQKLRYRSAEPVLTPVLPQEFLSQLKVGGRLFAVVGDSPVMEARLVTRVAEGSYHTTDLFETDLAPLRNALQPKRFEF
jgi:protein-L-isoaspartate(D-aspartate) O-methyltransferase